MDELLHSIGEYYGLKLAFFERVEKGFLSENFVLSDGSIKYFLKKYRFDNKERVEEVHVSKKHFSAGGIPVILPIRSKSGSTYFSFNGVYYALFPFIQGEQFERGALSDTAIVLLGEMLGRMQLIGKDAVLPMVKNFKLWDKEKALEKLEAISFEIRKLSVLSEFDRLAAKSVEMKRRLILSEQQECTNFGLESDHVTHGDYLDHNMFFDPRGRILHVFDFEKTEYCPRTYELFRSLLYMFIHGNVGADDIAKAKLYLASYLKVYPMSCDELQRGLRLFYLKSIHNSWVENEHYLKHNSRVDLFLLSDFERLKFLSENYKGFEKELLS